MAHTVSEVSELVTKCNQLSKEVLQLRQEQENHGTEIQRRDAQISELKGRIQLLERGASSIVDSESRLTLERDSLLAANHNQSLELNDRMTKIRQLEAGLKKIRLNDDKVKGQLTSLRSKVTAANERVRHLETENAQLKADLNVARQGQEPTTFTSYHLPQLEEEDDVGIWHTARAASNRRESIRQVAEQGAEALKSVEFLNVVIDKDFEFMMRYDPEMTIAALKRQVRKMFEKLLNFWFLKYDDRRIRTSQNDTKTLAEVGIRPNTTLRLVESSGCNLL
ncbi:uncharacterized protein LOC106166094 [Lingula anatina]|uniref:Uncharacterized protein LOC106166094 n=1 Tax=Lingula anatina TaxID=7574 RepID=A0A1S3IP34_LINAN|nr:uncharacterized protein LOC106166094 [Lingula anatina]|eukprot:XP_013399967.1 uncharacterized protein LOC106166094 [Lingula anatina]